MSYQYLVLYSILVMALSVFAANSNAVGLMMEEVKVTAQKKSSAESAQDVPISISAHSGHQIEASLAVNLTDIGQQIPNVNLTPITTARGVANFVIRGMGTVGQSIPSADPAVSVVMDGVAYGTIYGAITDLFDIESLEVLRGPQGTLFGRNATAGVVAMRSTRPGNEFQGKARVVLGSQDRRDLSLVLAGPLNTNWGGKLAVLLKDRDGYWKNKATGGYQGAADSVLVRPTVTYGNGRFDSSLILEYGKMDGDGLGSRLFWLDGKYLFDPYDDNFTLQGDRGISRLSWYSFTFEANVDVAGGVLTSILGWRDLDQDNSADLDGYSDYRFHFASGTGFEQDQTSLEVRWAGQLWNNTELTTGLYLFKQNYTYAERRLFLNAFDRRGVSAVDHKVMAGFAHAYIDLGHEFTLLLGGRYTSEAKDADIGLIGDPDAVGNCAVGGPPFAPRADLNDCRQIFFDQESWNNFSPKISLSWDISTDSMAFASFSRGFRSGGYNVRFTDLSFVTEKPNSTPGPYNEEVVDAFEIGIKHTIFDGRLRANASIFHNRYEDLQRTVLNDTGGQQILNAANASIRGAEIEVTALLTDSLLLEIGAGWARARYDSFDAIVQATGKSVSDLRFVMAPEKSLNAAITYTTAVAGLGTLRGRIAYVFTDETWANDLNTVKLDAYELIDGSVQLEDNNGRWQITLFVRNLTDEVYFDFGSNYSTSELQSQKYNLTPPRTFGAEFTWIF